MLPSYFVIIGTLIGAIGSIVYFVDTVRGRVKPNRVTFVLWSIAPLVAFAAQMGKGVGIESLMTLSTGVLPLFVFAGSFMNKQAVWKLTRFDLTCGFLSVVGLIIWGITREGNLAILFSILADGLAAIPTVVKAYRYPETEALWPWLATSIGVLMTLFTIDQLTFANSAFISYIFLVDFSIFLLVLLRPGKKRNAQELSQE